jgi:hypothetical protein
MPVTDRRCRSRWPLANFAGVSGTWEVLMVITSPPPPPLSKILATRPEMVDSISTDLVETSGSVRCLMSANATPSVVINGRSGGTQRSPGRRWNAIYLRAEPTRVGTGDLRRWSTFVLSETFKSAARFHIVFCRPRCRPIWTWKMCGTDLKIAAPGAALRGPVRIVDVRLLKVTPAFCEFWSFFGFWCFLKLHCHSPRDQGARQWLMLWFRSLIGFFYVSDPYHSSNSIFILRPTPEFPGTSSHNDVDN